MKILLICRYCNNKWDMNVWTTKALAVRCSICNDSNIRIIEEEEDSKNRDIFGYNYKSPDQKGENDDE